MLFHETIVAVSSVGGGARGIVRVSGERAWDVIRAAVRLPEQLAAGWYGGVVMPWLHERVGLAGVLLFKGPRSFTGEDVAELHVPDSPAIVRGCVERILAVGGVRTAIAGEFSARAFFNGKIDLTEAEGIAATINASTEKELRAATALREGKLHQEIQQLTDRLANLLTFIEAGIDFAEEEDIAFIDADKACSWLDQYHTWISDILNLSIRVDRLDSLPIVVFIGKPNVGKSSLINALVEQDRAIVSDIPGTTRDILAATMRTDQGAVRLLDVPGDEILSDELKVKMMDAQRLAILEADLVIRVMDHTMSPWHTSEGWLDVPTKLIGVQNKADLINLSEMDEMDKGEWKSNSPWGQVSAKTGFNIARFREVIYRSLRRGDPLQKGTMVLNQRHRIILQEVREAVHRAQCIAFTEERFHRSPELLASELRRALDLLGQITGIVSPDEILGRIFSTFCVGK
ncbi:MAG: 50S ribosome-binding GTPase [Phycisphaerales bacterium]|nr:50S ribosome-binding GTPase [Phycisphaerales bacterium]